jgi:hypothetical protein
MASLGTLKRYAQSATAWRGHYLRWHAPHHGEARSYQTAECVRCGKDVCINTLPMPNEIDIGGSAVALNCADS